MTATQVRQETAVQTAAPERLEGLHVEARDLDATQRFYACIFDQRGRWQRNERTLSYTHERQFVTFHQRAHPRVGRGTGQHQAYRVPPDRLDQIASELGGLGSQVDWWREDRPEERSAAPYALDPSENRVQLVPHDERVMWIDHVALEVHDLDEAEPLYVSVLGGTAEYWHGWRMDDYVEAFAWGEGHDPCAPWTRRFDVRYWDKVKIPRPNMQLFVGFGSGLVGLILAGEHHQEPSPEKQRGTPRVVLQTSASMEEMMERLRAPRVTPECDEGRIYLRDCSGNFLEIVTGA